MAGILPSIADNSTIANLADRGFGIVVSEWNNKITEALYQGAYEALAKLGVRKESIIRNNVPGCYELALGAQRMASQKGIDAVICLGCVIRGETPHFEYICTAAAHGILRVSLDTSKPIAFGVITALDNEQALNRAGGRKGNKGEEAALAVAKML